MEKDTFLFFARHVLQEVAAIFCRPVCGAEQVGAEPRPVERLGGRGREERGEGREKREEG